MTTTTCVGLYYGFTIFIVSLATAMTVMTLNIHHHGTSGRPVPPLVRALCFGWLRRLLCLGVSGNKTHSHHPLQNIIEVHNTTAPAVPKYREKAGGFTVGVK